MNYTLEFSEDFPKKAFISLVSIETLLALIYAALMITGRHSRLFSLDDEANIPSWFSASQLFLVGLILLSGKMNYHTMSRLTRNFIKLTGLGFIFLSADEAGGIHEAIGTFFKLAGIRSNDESKVGLWGFIYVIIGLAILFWGWKAIAELHREFRKELVLAAMGMTLSFLGGVVLESLMHYFDLHNSPNQALYKTEVTFEEYFEMLGISIVFLGVSRVLVKCQRLNDAAKNCNPQPDKNTYGILKNN